MSKKTIYKCDICREEKPSKEVMGVNFSSLRDFKLCPAEATDWVHVCFKCLKILRDESNKIEFISE